MIHTLTKQTIHTKLTTGKLKMASEYNLLDLNTEDHDQRHEDQITTVSFAQTNLKDCIVGDQRKTDIARWLNLDVTILASCSTMKINGLTHDKIVFLSELDYNDFTKAPFALLQNSYLPKHPPKDGLQLCFSS